MIRDRTAQGRIGRVLAGCAVIAIIGWMIADTVRSIHDFVFEHHGIAFYRDRLYLLLACLGAGILGGLAVWGVNRVLRARR